MVKSEDGHKLIAGHGIAFAVPDDWEPEYKETSDSQAFSWELHAAGGEPFPPFLNFTVVKKKDSADRVKEVATAAEGVAKVSEEGYELVDSGSTDVPGSDSARKLSFKRTLNLKSDGKDYPIEQRMLFFRTSGGHIVTVRFIASQGKYENSGLAEIADSLVVN